MPGLGRLDGRQRGYGVADLAEEDDVGVLPDDVAQRVPVAVGVDADLALLDDREDVLVHHLDRVLDRDDVRAARAVDVADHGGDRRGLAGAGGPGDEDEPAG